MSDFKARRVSARQAAAILRRLAALYPDHPLEVEGASPFRVLVATMLSARTKDPVTNAAMRRLWERASTPTHILQIPEGELAGVLKPVGFYRQKAGQLRQLCRMLLEQYGGQVPADREDLMQLPGVGRKTANLILNIAFSKPAICVDTHVHRLSNRLGWVTTDNPLQTEEALAELVPRKYWTTLNRALVNHGQQICQPISPRCSECVLAEGCLKAGVFKSR